MVKIILPDEIWNEIKEYLGIYAIPNNFKKMQDLNLPTILDIVKTYNNENVETSTSYKNAKKRMESMKKFLLKYFWRNMLNYKYIKRDAILQEIYKKYIENPFLKFNVGDNVFIYGYQKCWRVIEINKKSLIIIDSNNEKKKIKFIPSLTRPPIKNKYDKQKNEQDLGLVHPGLCIRTFFGTR